MKYCTYRSTHPSGFYYSGKGITTKVESGEYKGSGVKFKVTCTHPGFELATWTTVILEVFETEEEAFVAEELLVPVTILADPYCLNMQQGGLKGRDKNHSYLYRMMAAQKRREVAAIKKERTKARKEIEKEKQQKRNEKYRALQRKLKELK